jgi:tetratricopeptide (TPR) repeat protein
LLKSSEATTEKFALRNPDDYDSQYTHTVSLYRLGTVLEAQGKDEAKNRYAKCVEIREKLREKNPDLKNETMLMLAYARNGNAEKALESADRLNANEDLEGKMRIDIARAYVQTARFVDAADQKDLLTKKSLATIQQAIVGGYTDWFELQSEPDLKPLESNAEFVTMLEKLKTD